MPEKPKRKLTMQEDKRNGELFTLFVGKARVNSCMVYRDASDASQNDDFDDMIERNVGTCVDCVVCMIRNQTMQYHRLVGSMLSLVFSAFILHCIRSQSMNHFARCCPVVLTIFLINFSAFETHRPLSMMPAFSVFFYSIVQISDKFFVHVVVNFQQRC